MQALRPYTCLLVDDNLIERDLLEMLLRKIGGLEIIASCSDGFEALEVLNSRPVDIVFSDIDMPELSGMSLLKSLSPAPVFVFISAHSQYAAESFDLDVADFIVKPLLPERLIRAVRKAREKLDHKQGPSLSPNSAESEKTDQSFFLRTSEGLIRLETGDITYVESLGNFSRVHTLGGSNYVTLVSLKNMEAQLPADIFQRIHKQFMINLEHVKAIGQREITISSSTTLPLSPLFKQDVLNRLAVDKILERNPRKEDK